MGKLYLYYKKHNDLIVGDVLKVKIDDNITVEVPKNEIFEIELENGEHNIKMYFEGFSEDSLMGYIDENIEILENTYYIYQSPKALKRKGKFQKNTFSSVDEFKKYVEKSNKKYDIFCIILFIILILIYILV